MSRHTDWYLSAAKHILRSFFRQRDEERIPETPSQIRRYKAAQAVLETLDHEEVLFLRRFFLSRYGFDREIVKSYAANNHVPEFIYWRLINEICRKLFIALELIDDKKDAGNPEN